jgi:excisionase family DNA binding protein
MTLKEVANYLGVHEVTIYRLIKETDIPAVKLRGQWRFKQDVLDAWLMSRMNERGNNCYKTAQTKAHLFQGEAIRQKGVGKIKVDKEPS